jgi:hypothetical protein
MSVVCRIYRGDAATTVEDKLHAVVVGCDLGIQLTHGEFGPAVEANGSEQQVVGVVKAGKEVLNELLVIDRSACSSELIGESLHLGEVLCHGHGVLPHPSEGDAEVGDARPGLGGKHRLDHPHTSDAMSIPITETAMSGESQTGR